MQQTLERHQVWIYLTAVVTGLGFGWISPELTRHWEFLLWPVLAMLLYTTFTQIPLARLSSAFADLRFLTALLLGNFMVIPLVVGTLLLLLPDEPAIRLGVLMVLLMPCTDWFISFTHLGGGDSAKAIAAAPILLIAQLILLPLYIWLFIGDPAIELTVGRYLLPAFIGLILVPLLLAWFTQCLARWIPGQQQRAGRLVDTLALLPVPLLAVVVFLIAASQVNLVFENSGLLGSVTLVFVIYLVAAAAIGKSLSALFHVSAPVGRTLTFSFATRNSFVMLPLALSLPEAWHLTVVVIVCQSLIELLGMIVYLRWLPRLIRDVA
jgi:ACR3 family arsenite efflux pump ArsB